MPFYETVFIARQDLTTAQADGLIETFEKVITDQGGTRFIIRLPMHAPTSGV